MAPRPSRGHGRRGPRLRQSSAAAWWGYHYGELLSEPKPARGGHDLRDRGRIRGAACPRALFLPLGAADRPLRRGPPHLRLSRGAGGSRTASCDGRAILDGIRVPLRPHFGVVGVAPRESDLVDSVPPSYFGGNLDNWRLGAGRLGLPAGVGAGRAAVDRRPACRPGRRRTQRHRDRMLDDRDGRGRAPQARRPRRPPLRRPDLSADRDPDRLGADRLQPSRLPRRISAPRGRARSTPPRPSTSP